MCERKKKLRDRERMGKGRAPCCDKTKVKRGPWSQDEDLKLISFIHKYGHENWRSLPNQAGNVSDLTSYSFSFFWSNDSDSLCLSIYACNEGLLRCGKSCRLRWINYLRPDLKRGNFTLEEEETIIKLHQSFGNKSVLYLFFLKTKSVLYLV